MATITFECGCQLNWKEKRSPESSLKCVTHKDPIKTIA